MNNNHLLSLIIFVPLAGAVINWFVGRRLRNEQFIGLIACASVGISTILSFYFAFKSDGALRSTQPIMDHLWTWIQVGSFRADFGLAMDRLSGIYALFITFVGLLIHIFATGYMRGDSGYYRFFAYLNLFMFAMLTLILADNFLLMFVGWEGVGLCSYLLIGYYLDKEEAAPAAKKAFIANRVGDWGFVLGIMLVFFLTSAKGHASISFFDKPAQGVISALQTIGLMNPDSFALSTLWAGGITSVAVLLFIGATGKSAQIPLFVWLPDAMAGPTPVSALIHAATMVTAGVYMVVRCSAIFTHAPTAMFIVAVIGAATALFAATIGLAQNDIKKVLAYSTISQLGYMFMACGVGAFVAAIFHVMTHAFFKAQLFLGSGSVIHGMHHEQDMRRMGGLRKYMPITWLTMCAGWLAICGVPIWAGFFSKDEILWKVWSAGSFNMPGGAAKALWFVGAVTALLTAVYMTRLMVMTFWGTERFDVTQTVSLHDAEHDTHESQTNSLHNSHTPHESPLSMTIPLIVLAILSTIGGLVGVPYAISSLVGGHPENYFEQVLAPVINPVPSTAAGGENGAQPLHWLSPAPQPTDGKPAVAPVGEAPGAASSEEIPNPQEINEERLLALVSVMIALTGIGIGWFMFQRKPLLAMPRLLENKYYVDEIYDATIIQPIKVGAREGLWKLFDIGVIDGTIHTIGGAVVRFGQTIRYMQFGYVRAYAAIILAGAVIIIGYFAYSGAHVLRFLVR